MKLTDQRATLASKALAVVFGILGYVLVFLVKSIGGVLEVC